MIEKDTITDALAASRAAVESDYQTAEREVGEARQAWDEARRRPDIVLALAAALAVVNRLRTL